MRGPALTITAGLYLALAGSLALANEPLPVEGNPYFACREWYASQVPDYHRTGFRPWNAYRWPRTSPYRNYEIHPDVKCSYMRPSGMYRAPVIVRERY